MAAHNPELCSLYPKGVRVSMISRETEKVMPAVTEASKVNHQNLTFLERCLNPTKNGSLSTVADKQGGTDGFFGIKKVGIATIVANAETHSS